MKRNGDLEHANSVLEHGFFDWACFSAQQSAEKAVKAVFQKMGAEAWGHSVVDLLEELSKFAPLPEELPDSALDLDKVYISNRYLNAHPTISPCGRYTNGEARRLIQHAEDIIRFCEDLLSQTDQR